MAGIGRCEAHLQHTTGESNLQPGPWPAQTLKKVTSLCEFTLGHTRMQVDVAFDALDAHLAAAGQHAHPCSILTPAFRPWACNDGETDGRFTAVPGRTSSTTEATGRLRSRPRVNGTMQKAHMLLHPRMMDTKAALVPAGRSGVTSAYVSSRLSCTFMAVLRPSPPAPCSNHSLSATSGPCTADDQQNSRLCSRSISNRSWSEEWRKWNDTQPCTAR